jgi:hypothetical protein
VLFGYPTGRVEGSPVGFFASCRPASVDDFFAFTHERYKPGAGPDDSLPACTP